MTICVAGKNQIAIDGLNLCRGLREKYGFNLLACTNRNDDGEDGWQPSFARYCQSAGVPIVGLTELYAEKDLLFLSLEFDRIIVPDRFSSARLFNIHFSRLPAYKGMFTSVMPLLAGEEASGVTLHRIDAGIDTGEIIGQTEFPLSQTTTARELYDLYLSHSSKLLQHHLPTLIEGEETSHPQPAVGSSYFSKSTLDFRNIIIDLNKTAAEIHNQIRAFTFREYQLPVVMGTRIYRSDIMDQRSRHKAGTVVAEDDYTLRLCTVDYDVLLFKDKEEHLFSASESGDIDTIARLAAAGYPVHIRNKRGWDAVIVAAYHGQTRLMTYLLDELGFTVESANYNGTTLAMYAMTHASNTGALSHLKALLSRGPDLSRKDNRGRDIFSYAEQYGNQAVIQTLRSFSLAHD